MEEAQKERANVIFVYARVQAIEDDRQQNAKS